MYPYDIIDAFPYYTLLLRIFVDPSKVNIDLENFIQMKFNWACGSYFNVGFVIKFVNSKKIKIFGHVNFLDNDLQISYTESIFEINVPLIVSASWIDTSINFVYSTNSKIPFCLNQKIFSTGNDFKFQTIQLSVNTPIHELILNGDFESSTIRIHSSKEFPVTIQFIGFN